MAEQTEQRATYKFTSSKGDTNTELIDMGDGRVAAQGQEVDLTEEEAAALKATVNLVKQGEASEKSETSGEASSEETSSGNLSKGR